MIVQPRIQLIAVLPALAFSFLPTYSVRSQEKSSETSKPVSVSLSQLLRTPQQPSSATLKKPITISDAVEIFLRQNLDLVAARYDVDSVDAEKLTARLRPNPEISVGFSDIPLNFRDNFVKPQTFSYDISQTLELGGKRAKRMNAANANSEVARAQFQMAVWQATNELKRKFYAVVLAQSLLNLAKENQKTFAEIIKRTAELIQAGEIAGFREVAKTRGAQQRGFMNFEVALLIEQRLTLHLQGFELIAFHHQRGTRRNDADSEGQQENGGAHGGDEFAASGGVGLTDHARIINALGPEINIVVRK